MATKKPESETPFTLLMPFDETLERFANVNTRVAEPDINTNGHEASPFVKWAGGKRSIINELIKRLPETFENYYEPFMGGAALFYKIQSRINFVHS